MKKLLWGLAVVATLGWVTSSRATEIIDPSLDPLHFTCTGCGVDNGTFTPDPSGEFTGVSVSSSPANSGTLILKLLIPDIYGIDLLGGFSDGVTATGTGIGSANLLLATSQTAANTGFFYKSGSLDIDFLGRTLANGAPDNPIGAFLPSTNSVLTGLGLGAADGFFVATANLGFVSLDTPGNPSTVHLDLSSLALLQGLGDGCAGCWLMGDLVTARGDVTTAQSAALFATTTDVPSVPLPAALPLFVSGLAGLGFLSKKKTFKKLWGRVDSNGDALAA